MSWSNAQVNSIERLPSLYMGILKKDLINIDKKNENI